MIKYYFALILIVMLAYHKIELEDMVDCHDHQCVLKLEEAAMDVLRVDWKPISVFPEDATRFQ